MAHTRSLPPLSPPIPGGRWVLAGLVWAFAGWLATGPASAGAPADTLQGSLEMRQQFPFPSKCDGNTQEIVACLWERRNREDRVLGSLLGEVERLEQWRASRRRVCEVVAQKGLGGSIHPILWLRCENDLNRELLRSLKQPLLQQRGR